MFASHMARAKRSVSYASFPVLPPKGFNVALTTGAGVAQVVSNNLRESNGTTTNPSYSAYVFPEVMHTPLFTATAGNALLQVSSRGIGTGMFSDDGTKGVFFIIAGNTTPCRIFSWDGGVLTVRGTTSSQFSTSSSDLLRLQPSISAGVVTWNVFRNATQLTCNWTDSTHIMDLPGRRFAACFRHEYSGGHFAAPGIKSMAAQDL
jgi:hypothetical protein